MQLLDRIEKRRFVGRELLLWLWFESELFEGTLATKEHGELGLWIARQAALSAGKSEVTRIKGGYPTGSREAKEALLRGKLPDVFGIHVSWREREFTFVLKAESLSLSGLALPTMLGAEEEAPAPRVDRPPPRRRKKAESADANDERYEAFYERMMLTREIEGVVEALYRDFLALRLGPSWDTTIAPALATWASGEGEIDVEAYRRARGGAIGKRRG